MSEHRHFTVESTPAPADASQKDWCPFEDEGDGDLPDRSFVREDLRAEKARDDEISQRHFDEGWRLTNEMPDLVEDGWRARAVYAEHGHQLALRQWGELSTRVSAWQETARSLEKQLEAARGTSQAAPAPQETAEGAVVICKSCGGGFSLSDFHDCPGPFAHPTTAPSDALREVMAERQRQISVEGWTPEHDDEHDQCEMAFAAAVYALGSAWPSDWQNRQRQGAIRELWPWQSRWHKSTTQRRDLVKAGALILAEIERLDRAALSTPTEERQ